MVELLVLETELIDHTECVAQTDTSVVVGVRFWFRGLVYRFEEVEGPLRRGDSKCIVVCMWCSKIPDPGEKVV